MLKQELIAGNSNRGVANFYIAPHDKEIGVVAFGPQAQGIVENIIFHDFQLVLVGDNAILVAFFP